MIVNNAIPWLRPIKISTRCCLYPLKRHQSDLKTLKTTVALKTKAFGTKQILIYFLYKMQIAGRSPT